MTMKLTSETFKEGELLRMEQVLSGAFGFGCDGGNVSPQLSWSGAPAGTRSFAVSCYDPDAPTGSGFWHWFMVNIPADVSSLVAGAGDPASGRAPRGALEIRTDFGRPGYGGPCPPPGSNVHRYIFTVHALGVPQLPVTAETSCAIVGFQVNANTLASARLIGLFRR